MFEIFKKSDVIHLQVNMYIWSCTPSREFHLGKWLHSGLSKHTARTTNTYKCRPIATSTKTITCFKCIPTVVGRENRPRQQTAVTVAIRTQIHYYINITQGESNSVSAFQNTLATFRYTVIASVLWENKYVKRKL